MEKHGVDFGLDLPRLTFRSSFEPDVALRVAEVAAIVRRALANEAVSESPIASPGD